DGARARAGRLALLEERPQPRVLYARRGWCCFATGRVQHFTATMTISVTTAAKVPVALPIVDEVPESRLLRVARWGCYATAGALPLYTVRWHYGPLPTTLLETLILLTVAAYVIARLSRGFRRPLPTAYDILIAVLLVAGAISVVVATDHRGALGLYRAYFLEP